jgi:hypothetical protein
MYIPANQIDPQTYYTDGGEYYYPTNKADYVGFYRKDIRGYAYSGQFITNQSILLLPAFQTPITNPYVSISSTEANEYTSILKKTISVDLYAPIPVNNAEPPSQQEYNQGYYTRYILQYKLSSQPVFIEVNKGTYFAYVNSTAKQYFGNVELLWKISGPFYDQYQNGILVKGGVIDSNKRSLQQAEKVMPGISNYLSDLLLYYKR